jgi:hypothetical protein
MNVIDKQKEVVENEIKNTANESTKLMRRADTIADSTRIMRMISAGLFYLYIAFFFALFVPIGIQYVMDQASARDRMMDGVMFVGLALFPFAIYSVEKYIYETINYISSFLYNRVYVADFDSWVVSGNLYFNPKDQINPLLEGSVTE